MCGSKGGGVGDPAPPPPPHLPLLNLQSKGTGNRPWAPNKKKSALEIETFLTVHFVFRYAPI